MGAPPPAGLPGPRTSTRLNSCPCSHCHASSGAPGPSLGPSPCLSTWALGRQGACVQEPSARPALLLRAPLALPVVCSHGNQIPSQGTVAAPHTLSVSFSGAFLLLNVIDHLRVFSNKLWIVTKQNQLLKPTIYPICHWGVISKPLNVLWRQLTPFLLVASTFGCLCCGCCCFVRCGVVVFKEKRRKEQSKENGWRLRPAGSEVWLGWGVSVP